ncbi:SMI1/KNR4 family protein [Actinomycetes bacterium KLBMP 9797]
MTGSDSGRPPGARYAMSVIHPGGPTLRVRYRQGVLVTPQGYPDWPLCARAVVAMPDPEPGLTLDETRVVDVLAANMAAARVRDDPLLAAGAPATPPGWPVWTPARAAGAVATPPGWCWAHVALTRQLALVPVELHGAFRHAGGVSTLGLTRRGLRIDPEPIPVAPAAGEAVPDEMLDLLERLLGWPLPAAYRRFLAATNGAGPAAPAVLPGYGFVADQPLFGLARDDLSQDLSQVWQDARDRLTIDFLPIGYVQGGLLAVKVSGDDLDSIWYWDDDDPRDRDEYDAEHIGAHLLHRCADSIDDLWAALRPPAAELVQLAAARVDGDQVEHVRDAEIGAGLPPRMRAPWQSRAAPGKDPLTGMFEAR